MFFFAYNSFLFISVQIFAMEMARSSTNNIQNISDVQSARQRWIWRSVRLSGNLFFTFLFFSPLFAAYLSHFALCALISLFCFLFSSKFDRLFRYTEKEMAKNHVDYLQFKQFLALVLNFAFEFERVDGNKMMNNFG